MTNILILEDEDNIRGFIAINIRRKGYTPLEAGSVSAAREIMRKENVGIAIVDVMLPDGDGIEFSRELREQNADIGIIILTAKSRENDKISGLSAGADDYITKPFSTAELNARIDALNRRVELLQGKKNETIELITGPFRLNIKSRNLYKNDQKIELTHVEYEMIKFFMMNEGRALSREDILDAVWGKDFFGELKIVDVNIRRLRMKLEDNPSEPKFMATVWGYGYKWGIEDEEKYKVEN